jgi:hypothetical protein
MVFLENVGNIMLCGFSEVVEALTSRGFDMMWTTRAANVFGAPHCRNRWFCLAVKKGTEIDLVDTSNTKSNVWQEQAAQWYANEPQKRYTAKPCLGAEDETYDPMWIHRCHTLGNTVVPCVVRTVFGELLECMSRRDKFAECMAQYSFPLDKCLSTSMPDHGMIVNDGVIQLPQKYGAKNGSSKSNVKITIRQGEKLLKMDKYPTPRRGITHANTVTDRTIRDLPTVLVNCMETLSHAQKELPTLPMEVSEPNNKQHKPMTYLLPNVEYIEWMMNFPRNWTRVDPSNLLYPKVRASSINTRQQQIEIINKKEHEQPPTTPTTPGGDQ